MNFKVGRPVRVRSCIVPVVVFPGRGLNTSQSTLLCERYGKIETIFQVVARTFVRWTADILSRIISPGPQIFLVRL